MAAGVAGRRGRGEWLLRFCFTQPLLVWSLLRFPPQSPEEGTGHGASRSAKMGHAAHWQT